MMLETNTTSLRELMVLVEKAFPFTTEHYPREQFDERSRAMQFEVAHIALHMAKTGGRIAAEAESGDHGGTMNADKLRMATADMLAHTLRLAAVLGMDACDMQRALEDATRPYPHSQLI